MLKWMSVMIALVVLTAFTIAACASPQVPPEKELRLEQYPVLPAKRPMTAAEMHRLGLRVEKLAHPTMVFIHYRYGVDQRSDPWRQQGHWHERVLQTGTMVAVDGQGRPWYLLDGSNRLYTPVVGQYQLSPAKSDGEWFPFGISPWWLLVPAAGLGGLLWWFLRRRRGNGEETDDPDPDADPKPGTDPEQTQMPGAGVATTVAGAAAVAGTAAATAKPTPSGMRWMNMPEVQSEGVADPTALNALSERVGSIERSVAEIRDSVAGMDERVAVRLEPTIRAAAEGGGKARAKALLAEEIAKKAGENKPAMVASLTRVLESLN